MITTDTNKRIHRKLSSEPIPNSLQNLLSRRGENRRGTDGRFIQMSLASMDTEEDNEEESQSETGERRKSTPARETSIEQMDASIDFTPPTRIERGRPKCIHSRSPK